MFVFNPHPSYNDDDMKIVTEIAELRVARNALAGSVGLVPTMGYLHAGHLSLVEHAKVENDHVIATIYVNPTQFEPDADLDSYPRDLERDFALLRDAGVDIVWTPNDAVMYPEGFQTWVDVTDISQPLEGGHRPGHFKGVTTIVTKLFNATTPDRAYFGQKDAQQVAVIKRMVRDLNMPLAVIACPLVRDTDGVALSSRNAYLTPEQRTAAPILGHSLCSAIDKLANGERDANALRTHMLTTLASEPLTNTEYVSVSHPDTLQELETVTDAALLSMAVRIGKTRLIDNMVWRAEH